ncbi:MAG: hypothetical protein ACLPSL_08665 [Smithella sp.]
MAKTWHKMSSDEKLEKLRMDIIDALELIDSNKRRHEQILEKVDELDTVIYKMDRKVFEIELKKKS